MNIRINDNSISIFNHKITIDDMINEMYYIFDIAHCNETNIADNIYFSELNNDDRDKFNNFIEQTLYDAAIISHNKKPIFKNSITRYKSSCNKIYCLPILSSHSYNNSDIKCIDDIMININIFYKTLKFKIKQERMTKHIYKELEFTNHKLKDLEIKYNELKKMIQLQDKVIHKLCDCVDYKYTNFNNTINNQNSTINKYFTNLNYNFNIIKNRQYYKIIFIIIATLINIIISYQSF